MDHSERSIEVGSTGTLVSLLVKEMEDVRLASSGRKLEGVACERGEIGSRTLSTVAISSAQRLRGATYESRKKTYSGSSRVMAAQSQKDYSHNVGLLRTNNHGHDSTCRNCGRNGYLLSCWSSCTKQPAHGSSTAYRHLKANTRNNSGIVRNAKDGSTRTWADRKRIPLKETRPYLTKSKLKEHPSPSPKQNRVCHQATDFTAVFSVSKANASGRNAVHPRKRRPLPEQERLLTRNPLYVRESKNAGIHSVVDVVDLKCCHNDRSWMPPSGLKRQEFMGRFHSP
eukprot:c24015_g1_i1 orf=81-932(-)